MTPIRAEVDSRGGRRTTRTAAVLAAVAAACLLGARVAQAQAKSATIDPGMTKEQVVDRLGEASVMSHAGSFTYLFYDNECEKKCGMDDLVILERGIVSDAIFRSPKRTFTGISSSPRSLAPGAPAHFAPEPIRASTPDDSAHRGGIVLVGPRPPVRPSRYIRIIPKRADSARMASSGPAKASDSAGRAPRE